MVAEQRIRDSRIAFIGLSGSSSTPVVLVDHPVRDT